MPQTVSEEWYAAGDVFVRNLLSSAPSQVDTIAYTNTTANVQPLPAGTPLSSANAVLTNAQLPTICRKLVAVGTRVPPLTTMNVAVFSKFNGLLVNLTKLPNRVPHNPAVLYTAANWRTALTNLLLCEFIEESVRADNQPQ